MAHRIDAEQLEPGGGLEVLLAAAIERVPAGAILEIRTPSRAVALELPGWARVRGHGVVGEANAQGAWLVHVRRGAGLRVLAGPLPPRGEGPPAGLCRDVDRQVHEVDVRADRAHVHTEPRPAVRIIGRTA